MSLLNQGRNEIRVNNSGAKCLLENWVEERAVSDIDPLTAGEKDYAAKIFKDGHKGLLNTNFDDSVDNKTTVRVTYQPPKYPDVAVKGTRHKLMEQAYAQIALEQVERKFRPEPEKQSYHTEFRDNFTKEFQTHRPLPTRPHDINSEQPVTFWSENREKITGVSQVKTRDTVFRKNTSFSKPIFECYDETKPYDIENVPKM